jgi:hypothetical protein
VVKVEGMEQEEAAVEVVAVKGGAGNDLPQASLLDDFSSQRDLLPVKHTDRGPVAWVAKLGTDIVAHEIEIRRDLGITDSFGAGFVSIEHTYPSIHIYFSCF